MNWLDVVKQRGFDKERYIKAVDKDRDSDEVALSHPTLYLSENEIENTDALEAIHNLIVKGE